MSIEPSSSKAITLVESPETQLAQAAAFREVVLGQSDLEGTYNQYAILAGLEESLKQYKGTSDAVLFEVTLIRREAERKMGQMLLEIPRNPGARTDLTSSGQPMRLYGDILEDLNINPDRAHSWQLAARCPEDVFRELVESYRKPGYGDVSIQPITLEELVWWGRERMQLEERKQAQEDVKRRGKEEILPKVKALAESIPSYPVFEKRLKEVIGEGTDSHTQAAINKLIKRNYGEELERQQQDQQQRNEKDNEIWDKVRDLGEMERAITRLAGLQREGSSFRTLAAALQSQLGKGGDSYFADAIDFTADDVRMAIAYLEDVMQELESAR